MVVSDKSEVKETEILINQFTIFVFINLLWKRCSDFQLARDTELGMSDFQELFFLLYFLNCWYNEDVSEQRCRIKCHISNIRMNVF